MNSVLSSRGRLVSYLPGLHVLVRRVAAAPSVPAAGPSDEPGRRWACPEENPAPFGVQDQRFQLPANVGFQGHIDGLQNQNQNQYSTALPDLLTTLTSSHTQLSEEVGGGPAGGPFPSGEVECVVQSCPELLRKDFLSMFPEAPPTGLTVITVTQRSRSDMMSWSAQVDREREELLDKFIDGAKVMCWALQRDGYWADFIDPSSGLAFFGSYTNNLLFETDERYDLLGFRVDDLGCCRVITHALWGSHAFVGTIFTNAPPSAPTMDTLQETTTQSIIK